MSESESFEIVEIPNYRRQVQQLNSLKELINMIETLKISLESFEFVKETILIHKHSVLIFFQKFYNKITSKYQKPEEENNSKAEIAPKEFLPEKYRQKLQLISGLVKKLEGSNNFEELSFFHSYGSNKYEEAIRLSRREEDFLRFIQKIKTRKMQILEIPQYQNETKQIFDSLKEDFGRKVKVMNDLEEGYVRNLMSKIEEIIKKKKSEKVYFKINDKEVPLPKQNNFKIGSFERKNIFHKKSLKIIDLDDDDCSKLHVESIFNQKKSSSGLFKNFFSDEKSKQNESLCCRKYFIENQPILEAESEILEFKNYRYPPFNRIKNETLRKTICGFLNCKGGIIFIGIEENLTTKKHKVVGEIYTESMKEEFLKSMRFNVKWIEPEILMSQKMKISFIPIKSQSRAVFLEGRYVVKIKIYPGIRNQIYTFRNEEHEYFVSIRTENQILTCSFQKQARKIMSMYKERLLHPLPQVKSHECNEPSEGAKLFDSRELEDCL